ncbi:hypothetical protein GWI33_023201 [Rhynchophorus ferrugineus]|uniref:Uncharacterized protein n=1 Tax=Rhynchophorus ferrugineus TaxID=354439 RepID=A0A834M1U3_RHYFE|nr:hypothetical protein GWI33_023203 [Rhynchophorus ferrugineus]KAF7264454.1 hypothetical protein GWI33_023201 [Rhynchophorus ferrugineus]
MDDNAQDKEQGTSSLSDADIIVLCGMGEVGTSPNIMRLSLNAAVKPPSKHRQDDPAYLAARIPAAPDLLSRSSATGPPTTIELPGPVFLLKWENRPDWA